METKVCTTCKIEYPILIFPLIKRRGKLCHIAKCTECNKISQSDRNKKSYEKHKDSRLIKQKSYYENNIEQIKTYITNNRDKINAGYRKRYAENPINKINHVKNYYQKNKDKVNKQKSQYEKERKKIDPLYKLRKNIKSLIKSKIVNNGFTKKSKTHEILGCTFEEFKQHLDGLFEPWMTWDNYGLYNGKPNYGWDIDHIIPSSLAKTEDEVVQLNHYTNLQPLCSYINRDIKRNKVN